jgi:hypothetical protein
LVRPDGLFALRAHPFGVAQRAINFAVGEVVEPSCCLSAVRMPLIRSAASKPPRNFFYNLVRPDGFEPPTPWFEARRDRKIGNLDNRKSLIFNNHARGMSVAMSPKGITKHH